MLNGVLPFFGETTKIKKQEEAQKADDKKQAETTQVEAKKALSAFGNLSTQRANVDEVELTSSKKAEETSDEKENPNNAKKGLGSTVGTLIKTTGNFVSVKAQEVVKNLEQLTKKEVSMDENAKQNKGKPLLFMKSEETITHKLSNIIKKEAEENPSVLNELTQNIDSINDPRLQIALINVLSDKKYISKVEKMTLGAVSKLLKSEKASFFVKAYAVNRILNNKDISSEQRKS